ncbi:MAG: type II secretion system protein [Cyanobacteria bacterium SIG32]|nr:type II secretion system protein [Cyanobacteria bacterium SIG32]
MKKTVKNLITWSPSHLITSRKTAFTLAEVLITLAIIGVVAAMTIPTLISNYKEKATVTKVKKAYSVMNEAMRLATIEHGTVDTWGLSQTTYVEDDENSKIYDDKTIAMSDRFMDYLTENLRVAKRCTYEECGRSEAYGGKAQVFFLDGTETRGLHISNPDCSRVVGNRNDICGDFYIGFNNEKENKEGIDTFVFWITKNGLLPVGFYSDPYRNDFCLGENKDNRKACTAWVIEYGNMDYLECNDLQWGVKTKCD